MQMNKLSYTNDQVRQSGQCANTNIQQKIVIQISMLVCQL
jgi:hypothetical protein